MPKLYRSGILCSGVSELTCDRAWDAWDEALTESLMLQLRHLHVLKSERRDWELCRYQFFEQLMKP
jgi:hypothetical protein